MNENCKSEIMEITGITFDLVELGAFIKARGNAQT